MTDKLKEIFPDITFILWDERFTTTIAQNYLRDSGMSGKKKRKKVDMIAATLLLQSYLDYSNLTKDISR
ncbi:MAG: Holliday junction resolvase RuvX [Acetomicrobium sp.]